MQNAYAPRARKGFLQRKCDPCCQLFKWLPVLFVACVLLWGYYAFVVQLCFLTLDSETSSSLAVRTFCLLGFHLLYLMTVWSYWRTVATRATSVPRDFWLTVGDLEAMRGGGGGGQASAAEESAQRRAYLQQLVERRQLPVECRTYGGDFRLCEKCNLIKPDRAHHCSVCETCVLKMDHHCPWVNNCVCHANYKFFVLFLGYAFALCIFSAAASLPSFLRFWKHQSVGGGGGGGGSEQQPLHILFLFFVSIMFAISLVSLFGYHVFLTLKNRSTLESFRPPVFAGAAGAGAGGNKRAYDLGARNNWQQVFGSRTLYWFLPITTSSTNGLHYVRNVTSSPLQSISQFSNSSTDAKLSSAPSSQRQQQEYASVTKPLLQGNSSEDDEEEDEEEKKQRQQHRDKMVTINLDDGSEDELYRPSSTSTALHVV